MARDLDVAVVEAGRLVSWFALGSALLGPPLTIAASRMQPRQVVAAGLWAFALGNLAAALMPSYPLILGVRVVQGAVLPALVSVGSVAIAKLAGPGQEGRAVALVYLGVVVALVLAVPGGVVLAERGGWPHSFLCLALLAALAAALARHGLPAPCDPVAGFDRGPGADHAPAHGPGAPGAVRPPLRRDVRRLQLPRGFPRDGRGLRWRADRRCFDGLWHRRRGRQLDRRARGRSRPDARPAPASPSC